MPSLLLGVAVGVPLGMLAQRVPRAGPPVLALSGLLQTVPSLALLAFLVAALDRIGALPAILALFLYSLLPIVRGTETALAGVGRSMRDAARALGLDDRQRMFLIELPLARPGILAGIKTAAVINVGTATVAAFIGAGGFGERIVAGLAVNDHNLLLAGAIPAAALALLVEWGFRCLDRSRPQQRGRQPRPRARASPRPRAGHLPGLSARIAEPVRGVVDRFCRGTRGPEPLPHRSIHEVA